MKYTCHVDINKPVDEVVRLFDNPENLRHWQPGLLSYEHLEGEPGTEGARAKMHYKMGKRDVEMIETIMYRNFPDAMKCTYEANGVLNIQETRFEPIDNERTRYTSENEFQLKGFMKLMGWLMPGAFKKQTLKFMNQFKSYAESN